MNLHECIYVKLKKNIYVINLTFVLKFKAGAVVYGVFVLFYFSSCKKKTSKLIWMNNIIKTVLFDL